MFVTLNGGRRLGYAEHGDPGGAPVLWMSGTPSSRLFAPPDAKLLVENRVRLVVLERPGYGVSDAVPGRTYLDWPRDVAGVCDELQIARFAVVGFSGGGPFAAACAFAMPDRVRRLVILGAIAPPDAARRVPLKARAIFALARRAPKLAARVLRAVAPTARDVQRVMTAHLDAADQRVLAHDAFRAAHLALTAEALRQGHATWALELALAASPWGFALEDIRVPTRILWGARDRTTPLAMAHAYARIPGAELRVFDDAGHFVHATRWRDVVDALAA